MAVGCPDICRDAASRSRACAQASELATAQQRIADLEQQVATARGLPVDDETLNRWRTHLSVDLCAHFERVGESAVECDVLRHNYRMPEDQLAALAWLNETRTLRERAAANRDRFDRRHTRLQTWFGGLSASVQIIAIAFPIAASFIVGILVGRLIG